MRRVRTASLTVLGLALAALAVLGLAPLDRAPLARAPERLAGRAPFSAQGRGELRAGAGRARVEVPPGAPIAGYPAPRRWDGSEHRLEAAALALEAGGLVQVVAALPVLLLPPALEEEVLRRLGPQPGLCLVLAATHTHAGPGGTWDAALLEAGGNGAYAPERAAALAQAAAAAIAQAIATLGPARLLVAQAAWPEGPAAPRSGGPIDPTITAVRALRPEGPVVGTLVVYGMHPTVVPRGSRALSGDWPEAAAQELSLRTGAPALVLQGAGGDATWSREGLPLADTQATLQALGARVAGRASELLSQAPAREGEVRLGCSVRLVPLPAPQAGQALAFPVRRAATTLLARAAPEAALLTALELPGLRLLGVPAEPVGALGTALRARAEKPLALVGLADGYLGYVETPARAARGEGESARTWYGPGLAERLGLVP